MAVTRRSPIDRIVAIFTSLGLTIVCLVLGMVLILVGTLAQVHLGIHQVQDIYFRSWFVWGPPGSFWPLPYLPGGYLVGSVLMVNLIAAHLYRFKLSWRKSGILLVHTGLIVMLVGELLSGLLQRDSNMRLTEGETKSYAEADRELELAIIDRTTPGIDKVLAIPEGALQKGRVVQKPELPFRVEVRAYFPNSEIFRRTGQNAALDTPEATQGTGTQFVAHEIPRTGKQNERDLSAAWVELVGPQGSLGTWMVCNAFTDTQSFTFDDRTFTIELRQRRRYEPYKLTLLDFSHDKYPGTEIPRNFSSKVRLEDPRNHTSREVLIYMNHPLRYDGLTYYQSGYEGETTTILRVVQNPSRHLPYISCVLVGLGLLVQFGIHLFTFFRRRAVA